MIQRFLKLSPIKLLGFLIILIILAYSNHFNNSFNLDDKHTISLNEALGDFDIKAYFTDAGTFSAYPAHKVYRPVTTLENAIDYNIAGGLSPIPFHIHILLVFIGTCILIYLLTNTILKHYFNYSEYHAKVFSFCVVAFFGLAKANSETVNYIIQRAEITSAFFILLGLLTYIKGGIWKSKYLYLIFPIMGFMSKEMGFVFAPLLFIYIILFEENIETKSIAKKSELLKIFSAIKKVLPAFIITVLYYFFYKYMSNLYHGSDKTYEYFITQPMVISYYLYSYFFPFDLSTIPDWKLYPSIFNYKSIIGFLIIFFFLFIIVITSFKKKTKLIAFGLSWFFISLLPSSSIIAFAETANSHRAFIPYIGLTIAFIASLNVLRQYLLQFYAKEVITKIGFTLFSILILTNAYGTYQRNKVWLSYESLWLEIFKDNPTEQTASNNVAKIHMKKGEFAKAKELLTKGIKSNPYYSSFYINLAIILNIEGNIVEAEKNFIKATTLKHSLYENPEAYYQYGKFLFKHHRLNEAIKILEIAIQKSPPGFPIKNSEELLMEAYHKTESWDKLQQSVSKSKNSKLIDRYTSIVKDKKTIFKIELEQINKQPSKESYLQLSIKNIKIKKYKEAITAAKKALELDNNYSVAYNNMGFAYFSLNNFDWAIQAYNRAIKINPNYVLAKNNLNIAIAYKDTFENPFNTPKSLYLNEEDYIKIGLLNYSKGQYQYCIQNNVKSIEIKPTSIAYNNICTCYNQLKEFKKAEEACKKAIDLNPNNNLAKNNLKVAIENK
ncbi:tetratricopeptide repeat protein [Tenacibaculum sp. 190524A05c]|uniref:tetratricopeptide repeat protein n=1 Tax=Tenacibaculum platacis TaxID=3137852 RepID=UPI0032B15C3E